MTQIKDYAMVLGIIGSILGAGIGYGTHTQAIAGTKEIVIEVKSDVKENQNINMQQTIALTELGITLKQVSKTLDKVESKLDKK